LTNTKNNNIINLEKRDKMESITLNVRVDAKDKKNFEQFCNNVGMNISTAVNMFIKAVLREQKLPFEVKTNTFDDVIYEKLKEAEIEMNNTTKRYNIDEIIDSVNSIIDKE
jgi:DNA-damage-inducible protein J